MVYEIETKIDTSKCDELAFDNNGYCYNYALKDDMLFDCQDAYDRLDYCYEQIDISGAKKGDILSYHEINDFKSEYENPCSGNVFHFAVIEKTDGTVKGTIIKSKWGEYEVCETTIDNVLDIYGNAIVIWRKL